MSILADRTDNLAVPHQGAIDNMENREAEFFSTQVSTEMDNDVDEEELDFQMKHRLEFMLGNMEMFFSCLKNLGRVPPSSLSRAAHKFAYKNPNFRKFVRLMSEGDSPISLSLFGEDRPSSTEAKEKEREDVSTDNIAEKSTTRMDEEDPSLKDWSSGNPSLSENFHEKVEGKNRFQIQQGNVPDLPVDSTHVDYFDRPSNSSLHRTEIPLSPTFVGSFSVQSPQGPEQGDLPLGEKIAPLVGDLPPLPGWNPSSLSELGASPELAHLAVSGASGPSDGKVLSSKVSKKDSHIPARIGLMAFLAEELLEKGHGTGETQGRGETSEAFQRITQGDAMTMTTRDGEASPETGSPSRKEHQCSSLEKGPSSEVEAGVEEENKEHEREKGEERTEDKEHFPMSKDPPAPFSAFASSSSFSFSSSVSTHECLPASASPAVVLEKNSSKKLRSSRPGHGPFVFDGNLVRKKKNRLLYWNTGGSKRIARVTLDKTGVCEEEYYKTHFGGTYPPNPNPSVPCARCRTNGPESTVPCSRKMCGNFMHQGCVFAEQNLHDPWIDVDGKQVTDLRSFPLCVSCCFKLMNDYQTGDYECYVCGSHLDQESIVQCPHPSCLYPYHKSCAEGLGSACPVCFEAAPVDSRKEWGDNDELPMSPNLDSIDWDGTRAHSPLSSLSMEDPWEESDVSQEGEIGRGERENANQEEEEEEEEEESSSIAITCEVCLKKDHSKSIVLCDRLNCDEEPCDRSFHIHCLKPRLKEVPSLWFCPDCADFPVVDLKTVKGEKGKLPSQFVARELLGVTDVRVRRKEYLSKSITKEKLQKRKRSDDDKRQRKRTKPNDRT